MHNYVLNDALCIAASERVFPGAAMPGLIMPDLCLSICCTVNAACRCFGQLLRGQVAVAEPAGPKQVFPGVDKPVLFMSGLRMSTLFTSILRTFALCMPELFTSALRSPVLCMPLWHMSPKMLYMHDQRRYLWMLLSSIWPGTWSQQSSA